MPEEDYVFFGDKANAPYGNKTPGEVLALTKSALAFFREQGCKAMVIACNTATAAAADALRAAYPDFPIIAVEPALKPAVTAHPGEEILLLTTPLAAGTSRIRALVRRFSGEAKITLLPCPGLVELIEAGHLRDAALTGYLRERFGSLPEPPRAVVLGCTHYPHIAAAIRDVLGEKTDLYDGGAGTARRTADVLEKAGLRTASDGEGEIKLLFSAGGDETVRLAQTLLYGAPGAP